MKQALVLFLTGAFFMMTAYRLPAPISEIPQTTPTPKPKREAAPRSKPKAETTAKPKASPALSFAGTWSGNVSAKASDGDTGIYSYLINISDDEKTVLVTEVQTGKSGHPTPVSCSRFHDALTWSYVFPKQESTFTLRLNGNKTARLVSEGRWTSGPNAGVTSTYTGVFSRQ
jgi:hypothetical protein